MPATGASSRSGRRVALALALPALALIWILVNQPVEGAVLLEVTPAHGLTVADLPSLAAGVMAVLLLLRRS